MFVFGLVLLDVEPVCFRVNEPIDIFRIIALCVATMLAKLDAESLERAGVQSAQEAFDNEPRAQIQT